MTDLQKRLPVAKPLISKLPRIKLRASWVSSGKMGKRQNGKMAVATTAKEAKWMIGGKFARIADEMVQVKTASKLDK